MPHLVDERVVLCNVAVVDRGKSECLIAGADRAAGYDGWVIGAPAVVALSVGNSATRRIGNDHFDFIRVVLSPQIRHSRTPLQPATVCVEALVPSPAWISCGDGSFVIVDTE